MKKLFLFSILTISLLSFLIVNGCKKENETINIESVAKDSILKNDTLKLDSIKVSSDSIKIKDKKIV